MDNVKPVQKWADGSGALYDSEAEAIQGEARRIVRNVICDAVDFSTRNLDIDAIVSRRTAFIDALRKIDGLPPIPIAVPPRKPR